MINDICRECYQERLMDFCFNIDLTEPIDLKFGNKVFGSDAAPEVLVKNINRPNTIYNSLEIYRATLPISWDKFKELQGEL